MTRRPRRSRWTHLGMVFLAVAGSGCSQQRFGESVRMSQDRQSSLAAEKGGKTLLRLPDDDAFNVTESTRTAQGLATAESFATPEGTAACAINVPAGAAATAEFQLGHVVRNVSAEPQSVSIAVQVGYRYDGGPDGPAPQFAGLKLFLRDERDRTLRRVRLMSREDLFGNARKESTETPVIDLDLEPGTAYAVVVAGRLQAEVAPDAPAVAARFDVTSLTITVKARS